MNRILINCLLSVVFFFVAVICIRLIIMFRSKTDGKREKFLSRPSLKELFFLSLILVMNVVAGVLLEVFYKENTILFVITRFTVLMILYAASYFDLKSYIIPNQIIIIGLIARAIILIFEFRFANKELLNAIIEQLISAAVLTAGGVICSLVLKNGFGMGDVKLFAIIGLFFGATGSITIAFLSLLTSFFVALFLLIVKKKKKKDVVPFAPCVLLGSWVAITIFGV